MSIGTSRKALAIKILNNMREQASKAGYDIEHDYKGFLFQVSRGFLTLEELKITQEEIDTLLEKNKKAKGR